MVLHLRLDRVGLICSCKTFRLTLDATYPIDSQKVGEEIVVDVVHAFGFVDRLVT